MPIIKIEETTVEHIAVTVALFIDIHPFLINDASEFRTKRRKRKKVGI
ncbi:hypothetical protein PN836_020680 [Ningiella sp. W23]